MSVTVRRATGDDAGLLAELAAATFALACPPGVTQESVDIFIRDVLSEPRFVEYLADAGRVLFVAETDQPVGYAMLVLGEPGDPDVQAALAYRPTAELSKIYVLPQAHGTGASQELMAASLATARERGAAGVWLGVNQLNERAQRFYTKSGFTRVGTKRFLVGTRYEDDYVFEQGL